MADPTRFDFLQFPADAVAVVTGAASGIGRAIADQLVAAGVAVGGWDVTADAISQWAADARASGGAALGIEVDITDQPAVERAFAATIESLGPVGFLVNNAGPASTAELPFERGLAASAGSLELVTRCWLATPGSLDGNVVNISSIAGSFVGAGAQMWYPAAKAAIAGYTRNLAATRPNGIRANAIAPGIIETPRTAPSLSTPAIREILQRNPLRRPGQPVELAAAAVFLLAPASGYINGVLLPVDGGSVVAL